MGGKLVKIRVVEGLYWNKVFDYYKDVLWIYGVFCI